ncbi:MAG: transporter substrate-binding domain-containing protein, partial [Bacteroidales bacterium]|nr:transporter substrate-binding domain-containing protein [Bacteroidales bacterium]
MIDSQKKKIAISSLFSLVAIVLLTTFFLTDSQKKEEFEEFDKSADLPQILERGVLRATTNFNSTNYFVYRGEPMGFHLELLKLFANHLGVELQVYATNDIEENFSCLADDKQCDLIAMDLTVTRSRHEGVQFTNAVTQTR